MCFFLNEKIIPEALRQTSHHVILVRIVPSPVSKLTATQGGGFALPGVLKCVVL